MAAQSTAGARHPVSIGHLVMGVALLGLGVVWGLIEGGAVEGDDIRFLLPAPWILAGVAGLAALVTSDRRALAAQRRTATAPHPAPGTVEE
ncbi:hypothetical protein [Nocardioides sp.]|jgi:hypothetical protein|uniref:hypothetical protein n=1 Tax=Nocardioides sp. TaxID=35761 RepID=UPI002619158E|nr:hypothetical protein [Nocardioides sp.]